MAWERASSLDPKNRVRAGIRAGVPFAIAAGPLALSFGILAKPVFGATALLIGGELRGGGTAVIVALLGAGVALVLLPFAPAGIPVIAASGTALLGLFVRPRPQEAKHPEIEEDPVG
jgi:predicted branched-subunit amino acid permease